MRYNRHMKNFRTARWLPVGLLLLLPVAGVEAVSPERLRDVLNMAGELVPGGYVLEVDVDDPREEPVMSIEFDTGTEIYIDAGRMQVLEVERYREGEAGEIMRSTSGDIRNGISMWQAYEAALAEVDTGGIGGGPFYLYGIEYELRYGRLVLEIEFRRVAERSRDRDDTVWRRNNRYIALVDPVDGSVIAIREDRD